MKYQTLYAMKMKQAPINLRLLQSSFAPHTVVITATHRNQYISLRPEFFNFSFYRPDRPEFSKIEKKIKVLFFNFIFRVRSDSPKNNVPVSSVF